MIPQMNIIAWGNVAPWAEQRQIEQDLIISRAVIELFSDEFLREELRFRGGTALNKVHFPAPLRYSEDIDLVRTTAGPIKPLLTRIRETLEPWLGKAAFKQSAVAPKLYFSADAEDGGAALRLKVEINTRERTAYDGPALIHYEVDNLWFTGEAEIATFSREEMLATKLRALLQRDTGRDLLDLSHALTVFEGLDTARVATIFGQYLAAQELTLSRAQAEERMWAKLAQPAFVADIRPLLTADEAAGLDDAAILAAFTAVFSSFIARIPGVSWARTEEMRQRFGVTLARPM
ncbi:MAG: nucleotidyl transferase AbiEii/AbiGii toxin family protein [Gammaproteobacteria bacterium]